MHQATWTNHFLKVRHLIRLYLHWRLRVQNMRFYMFQTLSIQFVTLHMENWNAEGALGYESSKSVSFTTCDEVCQIKSSLLEGLLVCILIKFVLEKAPSWDCCQQGDI